MMSSKLGLDLEKVARARATAGRIVAAMQGLIERHTTTTVERAVLRLYGVDGVDADEVPLPNRVVDELKRAGLLGLGAARFVGAACERGVESPQEAAEALVAGRLKLDDLRRVDADRALERALLHEIPHSFLSMISLLQWSMHCAHRRKG